MIMVVTQPASLRSSRLCFKLTSALILVLHGFSALSMPDDRFWRIHFSVTEMTLALCTH